MDEETQKKLTAVEQKKEKMDSGNTGRLMVAKIDFKDHKDYEEVELFFNKGDIITIYGEMDEDGFYMGELNGKRGLVPAQFITELPVDTTNEI